MPRFSGKGAELRTGHRNAEADPDVRLCRETDLPDVLEVLAEAPEVANWSSAGLHEVLGAYGSHFLVARGGDEVLGFAVGRSIGVEAEILNVAVRPHWRRMGLGKVLLERLVETFESGAATTVFLEVRESNAAAIAFYRQLGFVQVGRRPSYYQQPEEAALVLRGHVGRKPVREVTNVVVP
jgi:[ribosomal protein S18]-alanine N-acetyltransferase